MQFSTEISRAVRYEAKRSEAAGRIIRMHKRHGEVVARVLEQTIAERAADLAKGTVDETSLLAMVVRKEHLNKKDRATMKERSRLLPNDPSIKDVVRAVLSEIGAPARKRAASTRKKPNRRDMVLYAAIMLDLRGAQYCDFLHSHGIKPKWFDSGPSTYIKSYELGKSWRKRVQDEKSRARTRFKMYPESELREALVTYLPAEFEVITHRVNSHNSRSASEPSRLTTPA